jgi:hypothetical protein
VTWCLWYCVGGDDRIGGVRLKSAAVGHHRGRGRGEIFVSDLIFGSQRAHETHEIVYCRLTCFLRLIQHPHYCSVLWADNVSALHTHEVCSVLWADNVCPTAGRLHQHERARWRRGAAALLHTRSVHIDHIYYSLYILGQSTQTSSSSPARQPGREGPLEA